MLFLALGQPDLELYAAAAVMQIQWNQSVSRTFNAADQAVDLFGVQQQFARARRVRQHMGGCRLQGSDMAANKEELRIADDNVGFLDLSAAGTYGFDLPAFQGDSRFEALLDKIIVKRFFILDDAHCRSGS